MLEKKEINKLRVMYFEQNYSVTEITRIMKISRTTCYKYLDFVDFSDEITTTKSRTPLIKYRDDIIGFLEEDRMHHHKQRHTGKHVYERLKEKYPDFPCTIYATIKYFSKIKKEFYYKHNGYLPLEHKAGSAQVDFGDCSFYEKGVKCYGKIFGFNFCLL